MKKELIGEINRLRKIMGLSEAFGQVMKSLNGIMIL